MHQMLGHAHWELEQLPKAIEHYEIALDQVPFISKAMESTMLHTLAKLCFLEGERDAGEPGDGWYSRARSAMESYVALATDPGPNAYYFLAQTNYAVKDYEAGIESVENAIRIAEESDVPVRENWTRLLEYSGGRPTLTRVDHVITSAWRNHEAVYWHEGPTDLDRLRDHSVRQHAGRARFWSGAIA